MERKGRYIEAVKRRGYREIHPEELATTPSVTCSEREALKAGEAFYDERGEWHRFDYELTIIIQFIRDVRLVHVPFDPLEEHPAFLQVLRYSEFLVYIGGV